MRSNRTPVDPDETVVGGITHESLTPIKDELWDTRAKRLVERALDNWGGVEPHFDLSAAIACLRAADGHLDPEDAKDLELYDFPGEEQVVIGECICPSDLLARGGFRGGCPVHG